MLFIPNLTRWLCMPGKASGPEPVWVAPRGVKPDEPGLIRLHWTASYFLLHDWVHDPEVFDPLEAFFVFLGGELDPTPCTQGDRIAPIERAFEQERLWLWHVPAFAVSEPAIFPTLPTQPARPGGGPAAALTWIEITLADESKVPVPYEPYIIHLPDGNARTGQLDAKGFARVEGIPSGIGVVSFPNIDGREWRRR